MRGDEKPSPASIELRAPYRDGRDSEAGTCRSVEHTSRRRVLSLFVGALRSADLAHSR
jgi:hypothetical protein